VKIAKQKTRLAIWWKTFQVAALYLLAITLFYTQVFSKIFDQPEVSETAPLSLALSFLSIQFLVIAILTAVLVLRKAIGEAKARHSQNILPLIREKIASYAIGDDDDSELRQLQREEVKNFEDCFVEFLHSMTGEGRERLSHLAIVLGYVDVWNRRCKSRNPEIREESISRLGQLSEVIVSDLLLEALDDSEETIRVEACRALIRSTKPEYVERAFSFVTSQSLLVRSLLTEELRPYAFLLVERVIPRQLDSHDPKIVFVTLEILAAWRNVLPLPKAPKLLRHAHPEVRAKALRALSYTSVGDELEQEIIKAFEDPDETVKVAAILAAARLKMPSALPNLLLCLRDGNSESGRAAAFALSQIGAQGLNALEKEILSPNQFAAAAALEIYERVNIGRCDHF
jgi:HEAT repeat protein